MVTLRQENSNSQEQSTISPPAISLPKGGGAIRGMGEKFAANPVTGTGSISVPITTSPGRSGFGPELSLSYDSGAGNGPFGFGWSLALPSITRKTDKGLPRYDDAAESDIFILSGSEDLVPVLTPDGSRFTSLNRVPGYTIHRYRPRVEGLFAHIERWTSTADPADVHWRAISRDNILTLYGRDENSRIVDPADASHIFTWLICETRDDKGNAILYEYKTEDGKNLNLAQAHEANRGDADDARRKVNRYIKHIYYGNRMPLLVGKRRPTFLTPDQVAAAGWMFEVVFDYGEHDEARPTPRDAGNWKRRNDPFSSYRSGFEVRTYRLCQRVLMFHHFDGEAGVGEDCLVRSTDLTYSYEENPPATTNPVYSCLLSVGQAGYKRNATAGYLKRLLPPLEFEYSQAIVQDAVQEVDPESLDHLPIGLDGATYQWTDLHGEGIPGILTEQAGAWFYKRNLSPINGKLGNGTARPEVKFAPVEMIAGRPEMALDHGAQFMDLAGDGQRDLVVLDGPTPGFFEHDRDEGWQPFRAFTSRLDRRMADPNLKFVDLDGDGHADVLISEDDAFLWHVSLAEEGFGPAQRVYHAVDEEMGPRLVFADATQSIYLADVSGDGLTDLVRVRNGEICYWPNVGFGRFGPRVSMDNAPWFDHPDEFDQRRIRLADIDGSGTTDVIYLHRDGVRLYFNQSGNSWSTAQNIAAFPQVNDLVAVAVVDLLGNGTACLVWSSPLPDDEPQPMRYVNLMGGQKPHLLIRIANNLGAETMIEYAPSTKFYLQDKQAGKPWITRLPFPVHCVEKVTVVDKWRQTSFVTTYSYHHGYFDGLEREFRGFGRVEQIDVEDYDMFVSGNTDSPYITDDQTLYQPPVKTVTWFHTGAFLEREQILNQFEAEYFPRWLETMQPGTQVLGDFHEHQLPEPDLSETELTAEEWRESLRACKGMTLRQEIYELDVDALARGEQQPVRLFTAACHNCHIERLQAREENRHAVFHVTESEMITYHYELDLRPTTVTPDPRIAHTFNLSIDEYGNVQQSVAVVYPRAGRNADGSLPPDALALVQHLQEELHLAYTETRYTNDISDSDNYRLRLPCEVMKYELTGFKPGDAGDVITLESVGVFYFKLDELRAYKLSDTYQETGIEITELAYHLLPNGAAPQKRLVEDARTLFFDVSLERPLPLGQLNSIGLPYESYKLALSDEILEIVLEERLTPPVQAVLANKQTSGYLSGPEMLARFGAAAIPGQYWLCAGVAGFNDDAADHFYLPERYTDPFGSVTTLEYDENDLLIQSSTDALGNTIQVMRFDYRVLAPCELQDINDNLSEVFFDVLSFPTAMAVKGKGDEGDNLTGLTDDLANPTPAELAAFFDQPNLDEARARNWLGNATARHLYYFGEEIENGATVWGMHPPCACGIVREQHVSQLVSGGQSPLQAAFEYSDGLGSVLVKKVQAEPEQPGALFRWVANSKTVLNNKGKPVKQYEPYFSAPDVGHRFEEPAEVGVTAVIYYDAIGRVIRTEAPDGSYSRVEFSPWQVFTFDQNDTVTEPGNRWFANKTTATATPEDKRAAQLAAEHASTPALNLLDSLGREVAAIAHNRVAEANTWVDEKYVTFTRLDAEGKPLWVQDARGNRVMQYIMPPLPSGPHPFDDTNNLDPRDFAPCYDIAGNLLYQHSMDAGDRWMLNDAAGKPMYAWDGRGCIFRTLYDALHRPIAAFITGTDPLDPGREIQSERIIYGDTPGNGLSADQTKQLNLAGKPYMHYDSAGLFTNLGRNPATGVDEAFDFKGNLLRSTRQLVVDYKTTPDWSQAPILQTEGFTSSTKYDALNRPVQVVAPHSDHPGAKVNIIQPGYNEASLLERVDAWLDQTAEPGDLLDLASASLHAVTDIDYDAKGQRVRIAYNRDSQPIITEYTYDPETFRLTHLVTTRPDYPDPARRTVQDLAYTFDPVGNITHITDRVQPRVFFDNDCVESSSDYRYDALYRLVAATGREHKGQDLQFDWDDSPRQGNPIPYNCTELRNYVESYRYDPVGNILQMVHHLGNNLDAPGQVVWNRRYQYRPDNNQLRCTSSPGEAPLPEYSDALAQYGQRYTYDVHGNMTTMPHLLMMAWDERERLRASSQQVRSDGGTPEITYYVYDADGQRLCKVTERQAAAGETPSRMKERIYLGGFEIYREYDSANSLTLTRETLHIMDDKQRIALVEMRTEGDDGSPAQLVRYQLGNHLGSASLELDEAGETISYEEYSPYGSTSYQATDKSTKAAAKRYRYTGKERDEETGFAYHGARYYAPWLGRWTAVDPINDLHVSAYIYVSNNPISRVDPDGMQDVEQIIGASYQNILEREVEAPFFGLIDINISQNTVESNLSFSYDILDPILHFGEDLLFIPGYSWWYAQNETSAIGTSIFNDFRTGAGSTNRHINDQQDPFVHEMRESLGIKQIEDYFYKKVADSGRDIAFSEGVTDYGFRFSPSLSPFTWPQAGRAHYDAFMSDEGASRLLIGAWEGNLQVDETNNTLNISITNDMSRTSYLYHAPGVEDRSVGEYRTIRITIDIEIPMDQARLDAAVKNFELSQQPRQKPNTVMDLGANERALLQYCDAIDCQHMR